MSSNIDKMAKRLRWAVWIFWACIVIAYLAGRFGLENDFLRVRSRIDESSTGPIMLIADATILLLSVALYQLSRMLGAIGDGDLFSARVVGAFRAFAFWLLLVALVWILAPIGAALFAGPDEAEHIELRFQLRDVLTVGVALILFLVARLLERARTIEDEMREIV
jgi:hypothetical protein